MIQLLEKGFFGKAIFTKLSREGKLFCLKVEELTWIIYPRIFIIGTAEQISDGRDGCWFLLGIKVFAIYARFIYDAPRK